MVVFGYFFVSKGVITWRESFDLFLPHFLYKVNKQVELKRCSDLTGEGKSKAYPCECGQAMCKQGEHCFAQDHYCVTEELMFMQGHHKNATK